MCEGVRARALLPEPDPPGFVPYFQHGTQLAMRGFLQEVMPFHAAEDYEAWVCLVEAITRLALRESRNAEEDVSEYPRLTELLNMALVSAQSMEKDFSLCCEVYRQVVKTVAQFKLRSSRFQTCAISIVVGYIASVTGLSTDHGLSIWEEL